MKPRHEYSNKTQQEVCEQTFYWLHFSQGRLASCAAIQEPVAKGICVKGESDNIAGELGRLKQMNCFEPTVRDAISSADLIRILDRAAEKGWKPTPDAKAQPFPKGGLHNAQGERFGQGDDYLSSNCSQYFREIMRQLSGQGFSVGNEWTDDNCDANCLIKRMKVSSGASNGEWRKVSESDAQNLANQGEFVEGASYYPNGSGHLATVFPNSAGADLSQIPGIGPLIRDGNEHPPEREVDGRLYAGTWGAIKASKAFDYGKYPPIWYVWVPPTK